MTRLAGANRFGTAADIARSTFGTASTVLLANGEPSHYPDALAGNYLAGNKNAPILLTTVNTLPAETKQAIDDLNATTVIILGGTAAVSAAQATEIQGLGVTVTRLGGADRYATAQLVNTNPPASYVGTLNGRKTAIVASGENFPDALVSGPLGFNAEFPIEITRPGALPTETRDALQTLGIQHVLIPGGTAAVSQAAEDQIKAMGITTQRFAGATRADTAALVADFAITNLGFSTTHVNMARGDDPADSLSGGPHGGRDAAATLLTLDPNNLGTATRNWLAAHAATLTGGHIFGGTAAVSQAVELAAEAAGGAGASNQTYTVSGGLEARQATAATSASNPVSRTCQVTLPAGTTYNVALTSTSQIVTSTTGQVQFIDTAAPTNEADLGLPNTFGLNILSVNGTTVGAAQSNNLTSIGTNQITIGSTDPNAFGDVTVVVWTDQAGLPGTNTLNLTEAANTNPKTPREAFGVGCRTGFLPQEAPGGTSVTTPVFQTVKIVNAFVGDADGGAPVVLRTFQYDANDVFRIGGTPQTPGEAGLTAFEAALSTGDLVTITNYAADEAAVSTFDLTDAQPVAPGSLSVPDSTGNTLTLTFPESDTATADSYNVYRMVQSGGVCPTFSAITKSQFALISGSGVADPSPTTDTNVNLTFSDPNLATNTTYCYAVTTVDEGDESNTAAQDSAMTGTATTDTLAPTITDLRADDNGGSNLVDAGDVHQFIFSEPMNTTTDDAGSFYRLQDADGTVADITCGTNAVCTLQPAGTYNGIAYPANQVLRVVVNGAVTPLAGFLGTTAGVQYPATVTSVNTATVRDVAGNALNTSSGDRTLNVDAITPDPTTDTTGPDIASAAADESADTIVLTYSEAIVCSGGAAQFGFTDADNAVAVAPTGISCTGNTVTLTFADGAIEVADATPSITYTDDNAGAVDANDIRDINGNQAQPTESVTPTVVA